MYRLKKSQITKVTIPAQQCIIEDKNFVYPSPDLEFGSIVESIFIKHGIYDQLVNYNGEWSVKIQSLESRPLVVSKYTSYAASPEGKTVIAVAHLSQNVLSINPEEPPSITPPKPSDSSDLYFDPLIEFELLPTGSWNPIGVIRWNSNYKKVQNYHEQLELDYYVNAWARRIHNHYINHESCSIVTLN